MIRLPNKYIFRISEWWNSKIAMFSGFAYFFALLGNIPFKAFIVSFLGLLVWYFSAASFGYFINDIYDEKSDSEAGKETLISGIKKPYKPIIALLLIAIQSATLYYLLWLKSAPLYLLGLGGLTIVLFLLYSHPSTRWKEKTGIDLVTDAWYAQILPIAITYIGIVGYAFNHSLLILICLFLWAFMSGVKNIMEHQLIDYDNDTAARIKNFTQNNGYKKTMNLLNSVVTPAEYISFGTLVLAIYFLIPQFSLFFLIIGLFVFALSPLGENILNQIRQSGTNQIIIDSRILYESGIFTISLLVLLLKAQYAYLIILPVHLLLFKNEILKQTFSLFYRAIYNFTMFVCHKVIIDWLCYRFLLTLVWHKLILGIFWYKIVIRIWSLFKLFVNYLIYYFRKYILLFDETRAKGEKK